MRTSFAGLILTLVALTACGGHRNNTQQEADNKPTAYPLVVSISVPPTIGHPGDPIPITAVLANHGQTPITVCTYPGYRFELVIQSGDIMTATSDGGQRRLRTPGATTDTPTLASDFTTLPPGGTISVTKSLKIPAIHGEVTAPMAITATFTSGAIGIEHGYLAWTGKVQGSLTVSVSPP